VSIQKRAADLQPGDVIVGLPAGPMTVRLVSPSRRGGQVIGVRIACHGFAPITGTPVDKLYDVEEQPGGAR